MTKAELNACLATPPTASKLKKTTLADLQAMIEAQKPKTRKPRELPDRVFGAGEIVFGRLFERRNAGGTQAARDSARRILCDELRGLVAGVCEARFRPCAQLRADRFAVHVLLVVKRLLRPAREQAKALDLSVPEFGVRRCGLAGGFGEFQSFGWLFVVPFCSEFVGSELQRGITRRDDVSDICAMKSTALRGITRSR